MLSKTGVGPLFWLFAAAFLFPSLSAAADYGGVELAPRESGAYRAHVAGESEVRWKATWEMERIEEGPPARYAIRDELRGKFGEESREQTRITRAEFLLDRGRISLLRSLLTVSAPTGEVIFTLDKIFDHQAGVVRTRSEHPDRKEVEEEEFEMGSRLVDNKEIASFLRGFPFPDPSDPAAAEDQALEFNFLNETPNSYSVLIEYEGIEEVETPAGKFLCHRLRLVPDLGILTFLGRILAPDFRMWFAVEPPHFWVKYNGLEGELGTEEIISELVEFETGGKKIPSAVP